MSDEWGGEEARTSGGVHPVVEAGRAIGAVVAGWAAPAVVFVLWAVVHWAFGFKGGDSAPVALAWLRGGLLFLLMGTVAGLVAAAIARPRQWLSIGLAPALPWCLWLVHWWWRGAAGHHQVMAAIVFPTAAFVLGGIIGAVAVRALRVRKDRADVARLSASES